MKKYNYRKLSELSADELVVEEDLMAMHMLFAYAAACSSDYFMESCAAGLWRRGQTRVLTQMKTVHSEREKQFRMFSNYFKKMGKEDKWEEDMANLHYILYAQIHRYLYKNKYYKNGRIKKEWAHEIDKETLAEAHQHLVADTWTSEKDAAFEERKAHEERMASLRFNTQLAAVKAFGK